MWPAGRQFNHAGVERVKETTEAWDNHMKFEYGTLREEITPMI
jgi:hypothetical protein